MPAEKRRMKRCGREGFSVLEAIISLAISALALTLVYSIGDHASRMGFSLGRRIIRVSDADLETQTLSAIVAGMSVPTGIDPVPGTDDMSGNFEGTAKQLTSSAVLQVDTPCARKGDVEKLTLALTGPAEREVLTCQANGGPPKDIVRLDTTAALFSYSRDGRVWVSEIAVKPGVLFPDELGDPALGRFVYVRLTSTGGRILFLGRAWSQRPRFTPKALENL